MIPEKIFILGLNRIPKYTEVCKQLDKLNLEYFVFDGFDREQIHNQDFSNITKKIYKGWLNYTPGKTRNNFKLGHICCTLGHTAIYKYCKMMNLKNALIFEDDVVLSNDFIDRLKYLDEVPEDADIIYLGSGTKSDHLSKKYRITDHIYNTKRMELYCLHSYIAINFDKLINIALDFETTIDMLFIDAIKEEKLKSYALIPHISYQRDDYSIINKRTVDRSWTKTFYAPDSISTICGYDKKLKTNKIKL